MTVETHIHRARTHVQQEREAVGEKRDAVAAFLDRVEAIPTRPTAAAAPGVATTAGAGVQSRTDRAADERCGAVRAAFAETVRPYSVTDGSDESLLATIRSEFTDSLALALAPTTETSFSARIKRALVAEATDRRAETEVLRRALDREDAHLADAATAVDEVTAWIAEADETPLSALDFDALRARHDRLAAHRERCDDLARERQAFFAETTALHGDAGIRHRGLVTYLYDDFPTAYPVLTTVARLADTCESCQRAVRGHLTRRV